MFNKLYEYLKTVIKENFIYITFLFVLIATSLYELPYIIYNGGGLINVENRISIENSNKSKGSFNMAYVSEAKATPLTYIIAKIMPNWELIRIEEVTLNKNETSKDIDLRSRLFLNEANANAIRIAYETANKEFRIVEENLKIIFVAEEAETTLRIGDTILEVNNYKVTTSKELNERLKIYNLGDIINFKIIRNNKETTATGKLKNIDNKTMIGIAFSANISFETDPKINLRFKRSEGGPSGGLILSLAIYDRLTEESLTNNQKIAGTGTIDNEGNIGEVGGIKYKLRGAVKRKADIFLVPLGENYQEALRLKNKHNYNIQIIGVSTFNEALERLSE